METKPWIAFFSQTGSEINSDIDEVQLGTIKNNVQKFKWYANGN